LDEECDWIATLINIEIKGIKSKLDYVTKIASQWTSNEVQ